MLRKEISEVGFCLLIGGGDGEEHEESEFCLTNSKLILLIQLFISFNSSWNLLSPSTLFVSSLRLFNKDSLNL